jgi:hypothetical protein
MFTSRPRVKLLLGRAQRLLGRLNQLVQNGTVTTQTGLLVGILSATQQFLAHLSGPSLEVPDMSRDDLLQRRLVEEPLDQAREDVSLAWEEIDDTRNLTLQVTNLCLAEQAGLKDRLAEVTALVDSFRLWVSDAPQDFIWVGDMFNDLSKVDPASTAWVNTTGGWAGLKPTTSRSMSPFITRCTLDHAYSQGGVPGNNLEVRAPGTEILGSKGPEPHPVLYRDTTRTDRVTALWDADPSTYFEWERVLVDVPQRMIKAGYAFVYDPAGKPNNKIPALSNWNCYIQWPGEEGLDTGEARKGHPLAYFVHAIDAPVKGDAVKISPIAQIAGYLGRTASAAAGKNRVTPYVSPEEPLQLGLQIELDQPRTVSWLELTPLIRGGVYPTVSQILVSRDGEVWRSLLSEPTVLHPRMNRGVDLAKYGVTGSNFEGVGVWPLPSVEIRFLKILLTQPDAYECPLGIGKRFFFNHAQKKRVRGTTLVVGNFASAPGDDSENPDLADTPINSKMKVRQGFDLLNARRKVIALRDLLLEERLYATEGMLLAKPYTLSRPVKAVALLTTEQIPEDWPTPPDGGRWIEYEVSPNGSDWHRLIPQETELSDSVVEFATPTTRLYFRATFNRPEDAPSGTGVLNAYAIKGLPA